MDHENPYTHLSIFYQLIGTMGFEERDMEPVYPKLFLSYWLAKQNSGLYCTLITANDTIQGNKEMTKESHYHPHYEKSSQLSSKKPTKDLADLTGRRNGQRQKHQLFFLLVFLRIKQVVNKLGSLEGSR